MAGSFLRGLRQLTIQLTACLLSFQEEIDLSNREHHQILDHIATGALIPVALKGVTYRPLGADALLRRNLLVWGLGGVILPFPGIKLIDMIMVAFHFIA